MGIRFLLLDEDRKFFSLISDIFDVTGHKLLVALDEQKAKDLLDATSFDIILMELKHLNFWLDTIRAGKYPIPMFFIDKYEDAEKLRALGFTDLNFVILPFNPLDLLTKAVWLNRGEVEPRQLSLIGPVNLLLHLLRRSASSIMSLKASEKNCSIYIKEGQIVGTTCDLQALREILTFEDVKIELFPYTGESYPEEGSLGNEAFFTSLFLPAFIFTQDKVQDKTFSLPKKADLTQPVELERGLFWVGVQDSSFLLHSNVYLRIYEREDIKIPLLINTGTLEDYAQVKAKIEEILSTMDIIKAVVLLDSEPKACATILSMLQSSPKLQVITSISVAKWLNKSGVPMSRIRLVESLPDMKLKLSTGDVLRIVPTPFSPYKGTFALYEEETGFLFTSHLFSSLRTPEEFSLFEDPDVEDVVLYASLSMPCSRVVHKALEGVEGLRISKVFPAWGNPLGENTFRMALKSLKTAELGTDLPASIDESSCFEVINRIIAQLNESEFIKVKEELEKYVYFENGTIKDTLIHANALPNLFIASMRSVGIDPALIKHVIRELFYKGITIDL
ncbi:hypothetical protein [Hydrogenobacter hydrogenophilus]|uniref:ODP domain-containing protein n=1 Tax=Hydrogenobacter hydrogenophilus TaxID=35835 RepID=A0A285NU34_9AQUI|nr:hypothetical protein [Hydrogenobacter hydrogenophilus]SNZ11406.1 hypothetical protein SAMN06265353_0231 [Hydrogenobacter hydrogenophilus]